MTYLGHYPVPEPERTDPGPQVTPALVVALVVQRLDRADTAATLTPESWDAAEHQAAQMLAVLGALPAQEQHP